MNAEKYPPEVSVDCIPICKNKVLGHNFCIAFSSIFREACEIGKN